MVSGAGRVGRAGRGGDRAACGAVLPKNRVQLPRRSGTTRLDSDKRFSLCPTFLDQRPTPRFELPSELACEPGQLHGVVNPIVAIEQLLIPLTNDIHLGLALIEALGIGLAAGQERKLRKPIPRANPAGLGFDQRSSAACSTALSPVLAASQALRSSSSPFVNFSGER